MSLKVTVTIPVYNGEKYIGKTLDSLISQSYDNYEIIVVDNASSDKTAELVQKYSQVKLIINDTNIGAEANFNKCLTLGDGELIALYHADDIYHQDIISQQVAAFTDATTGVCGTLGHIIDENDNDIGFQYQLPMCSIEKFKYLKFNQIFNYLSIKGYFFIK